MKCSEMRLCNALKVESDSPEFSGPCSLLQQGRQMRAKELKLRLGIIQTGQIILRSHLREDSQRLEAVLHPCLVGFIRKGTTSTTLNSHLDQLRGFHQTGSSSFFLCTRTIS